MGSWAPAEPISPYGAHMGDPHCAPTMRAPTLRSTNKPCSSFPNCAPTLRPHKARPQCALTLRAHMGDMGSTHPVWVHWFPYGAPHGGSGRKRSPRGGRSHYSLKGSREFFISNQAAVERVPDNFNLPLSILFFVDSPALLREKAARRTARRSLGRTTRLGRPNNLALPSHPDSLQIFRKHQSLKSTPR